MKKYKLIINGENRFSISNETDCDVQSDYFPGLWGLKSQKSALKYAKEYLAEGNKLTVTEQIQSAREGLETLSVYLNK